MSCIKTLKAFGFACIKGLYNHSHEDIGCRVTRALKPFMQGKLIFIYQEPYSQHQRLFRQVEVQLEKMIERS